MRKLIERAFAIAITLGFAALGWSVPPAQAITFLAVNTTSDTVIPNACLSGLAGCSLRAAMQTSGIGNVLIHFNIPTSDPSCLAGVCTISITSDLPALTGSNVLITGSGPNRVIIQRAAGFTPRGFFVNNPAGTTTTISGLTITDISNSASPLTKTGAGTLQVNDTILSSNRADHGGGLAVLAGTVNLFRTAVHNNLAVGDGGGIIVRPGAICIVVNSSIVGNQAHLSGGGMLAQGALTISNSTITNNFTFGTGLGTLGNAGGILNESGVVNIKSTIIANNTAPSVSTPDVAGMFGSAGFNLVGKIDGSSGIVAPTDLTGTVAAPLDARLDPSGFRLRGGRTPTRATLADSPAIDKGSSSPMNGDPLLTDQRGTGFDRARDNPLITNAAGGDGTDIGAYERHISSTFDFDRDGRTDIGIFRPGGGEWWINNSLSESTRALQFGSSTDRITPADFTGDSSTDIAFWRPSTGEWFVLRSEDFSFLAFGFGTGGDIPAPGDFDGDRKADAAVFRPSTGSWFILRSTGGVQQRQFGVNGDLPVVADYDGDGVSDIAIFRPSVGQWWLNRSTAGVVAYSFGASTDKAVPGDYTGDNKADIAFWRPSNGNWFVLRSENSSFYAFAFGANGDGPAPGDYDGDGKFDATVFRPSSATWFSQRSNGGSVIQQFGANGDRPIANAFVP